MSRRTSRQQKTGFAVWFLLIGFPVAISLLVAQTPLPDMVVRGLRALGALPPDVRLDADVDSAVFSSHASAVARRPSVRISAPPPKTGFKIAEPECDWLAGRVSFRVFPTGFHREKAFSSFDIAAAVADGVSARPTGDGRPLYAAWSVLTNAEDLSWTVGFAGVRPGGTLSLEVGGARASVGTEAPSLGGLSGLWRDGRLAFFGDRVLLGGRFFRRGDFHPPDPGSGTPGFRVLCVEASSVWLEIVYDEPSGTLLDARGRWPGVAVDNGVRDDGGTFKLVRFEGGFETEEGGGGKALVLPEKDRLFLRKGGILARNAVRFSYQGRDGKTTADLLVLTTR